MFVSRLARGALRFSSLENVGGEPSFLKMVEGYFNKAAKVAGIEDDRINFLKSP